MEEFPKEFDLFLDREKVVLAKRDSEYKDIVLKIEEIKKRNQKII